MVNHANIYRIDRKIFFTGKSCWTLPGFGFTNNIWSTKYFNTHLKKIFLILKKPCSITFSKSIFFQKLLVRKLRFPFEQLSARPIRPQLTGFGQVATNCSWCWTFPPLSSVPPASPCINRMPRHCPQFLVKERLTRSHHGCLKGPVAFHLLETYVPPRC